MLTLYHSCTIPGERPADLAKAILAANVTWIDLLKPEPDEAAFVERTTGLEVPSIEDLSEIESSSRLRHQNGAIYLSAPLIYRGTDSDQTRETRAFARTLARRLDVPLELHDERFTTRLAARSGAERGGAAHRRPPARNCSRSASGSRRAVISRR